LSTHGSNSIFRFVSMNKLEFFLLIWGLDSKFQHHGTCKNS
jgi:hypothetical protein